MTRPGRRSPLAYLAAYVYPGQHRAGRTDLADRLDRELAELRARAAARRNHPAGRRLTPGATTS